MPDVGHVGSQRLIRVSKLNASRDIASNRLIQAVTRERQQGNVLLIKHTTLAWPDSPCLVRNQQSFGQAVHLSQGLSRERYSGFNCRTDELPFIEASFRLVVLWHVISAGQEPELFEACRVLIPGGEILLLGLNQLALGARFDHRARVLPRMRRQAVEQRLLDLDMQVTDAMGSGLAGFGSPMIRQGSWSALMLPFTDQVALRVQHASPSGISPLRVKQFQAGVAPSA